MATQKDASLTKARSPIVSYLDRRSTSIIDTTPFSRPGHLHVIRLLYFRNCSAITTNYILLVCYLDTTLRVPMDRKHTPVSSFDSDARPSHCSGCDVQAAVNFAKLYNLKLLVRLRALNFLVKVLRVVVSCILWSKQCIIRHLSLNNSKHV